LTNGADIWMAISDLVHGLVFVRAQLNTLHSNN